MPYTLYNLSTQNYRISGNVPREHNCNGFTVTNIGDVIALVNGKVLFPSATPLVLQGDSISYGGNEGEVYVGYITIAFDATTAGTNPNLEIIQKFYVDDRP